MKRTPTLLIAVLLAPLAALHGGDLPVGKDGLPNRQASQVIQDSSFEACPSGSLAGTNASAAWEDQRTGREAIRDRLVVACIQDGGKAKLRTKCLALSIPNPHSPDPEPPSGGPVAANPKRKYLPIK